MDIESLVNCIAVSPNWLRFIKEHEIIWQQYFSEEFPLHEACKAGNQNKVKLLIAIVSDINLQDSHGRTPLHWACVEGHLHIVEYLLENPFIDINIQDNNGRIPLHWACICGHLSIVELFRHRHRFYRSVFFFIIIIVESLLKHQWLDVNIQDNSGKTPLHWACYHGHLDIVKSLLKNPSIDVNIQDNDGRNPLNLACIRNHLRIAEFLSARQRHRFYRSLIFILIIMFMIIIIIVVK